MIIIPIFQLPVCPKLTNLCHTAFYIEIEIIYWVILKNSHVDFFTNDEIVIWISVDSFDIKSVGKRSNPFCSNFRIIESLLSSPDFLFYKNIVIIRTFKAEKSQVITQRKRILDCNDRAGECKSFSVDYREIEN